MSPTTTLINRKAAMYGMEAWEHLVLTRFDFGFDSEGDSLLGQAFDQSGAEEMRDLTLSFGEQFHEATKDLPKKSYGTFEDWAFLPRTINSLMAKTTDWSDVMAWTDDQVKQAVGEVVAAYQAEVGWSLDDMTGGEPEGGLSGGPSL